MTNATRQRVESAYTKTCTDPISSLYGHYRDPPNRLYRKPPQSAFRCHRNPKGLHNESDVH